jgi:hypothetical protein
MKKVSRYVVLMVISLAFILTGCGGGIVMPKADAKVYGNGGTVVQKGEYLYFTNAYTPYSSLESEVSNGESNKEFGIYRVKLSSINNATVDYNENGFAENVEKITPTLSGFENSGLYIVGDYLFFASPNMHKTSKNENKFDYITLFSIKLNGSGLKELYTTKSSENVKWKVYEISDKNYLVTVEGDKVIRHEISKNKLVNKTVLVEDAKSVMLPENIISDFDKDIYYIKDFTQEQKEELFLSGDVFEKVNLVSAQKTIINQVSGQTTSLLMFENSRLVYKNVNSISGEEGIYVLGQASNAMRISYLPEGKTNFFFMGDEKPLIYKSNSKVWMHFLTLENKTDQPNNDPEVLIDQDATVHFVVGDYVYYSAGEKLNRISYTNKEVQNIIEGTVESKNIDFDGRYIYLYKTLDKAESQTNYLNRVDTFSVETSKEAKFEVIGFVLDKDVEAVIKAIEEEKKAEEVA